MNNIKNFIDKKNNKLNHEQNLINYFSNQDTQINTMAIWNDFCDWAVHYNDGSGEIISFFEELIQEELSEEDFDDEINNLINKVSHYLFHELPENIKNEFFEDYEKGYENTKEAFSILSEVILPEDTLLIHFTNTPDDIILNGFTKGVRDINLLAETVRLPDYFKSSNGYNFAYLINQKSFAIQNGAWAKEHAIIFKSSGVKVFHYGDKEEQVIFWGKNANLKDAIILNKKYDSWNINNGTHNYSLTHAIENSIKKLKLKNKIKIL